MVGKRGAGIALSTLALVAASAGGAPVAQAHGGGHGPGHAVVDCSGREDITYTPGLGLSSSPSAVSVDGTYHCADGPGHLVTATYHTEGTTGGSCLLLAGNRSEETLHYADGSTTVIAYRSGPSVRLVGVNTAVLDGVVVAGRGKGSVAEKTIHTLPAGLPTDCVLAGGIKHTIAFTHLSVHP
ncbi:MULTISPECIES: hypothetical protein [Streptomyces]|uniref:Secreted protein n=1 Tax=Streptomyces nondiastaticus TaxID=3154512 RepID=A0ABW6U4B4_9ACTN|nr:hypothetical protein [Streptomyces sp. VNUA116]WKU43275.1 hypothetical protein Q3V23_03830 [Streptomyces sp. VNUA116]